MGRRELIQAGDHRALAALIRELDDGGPASARASQELHELTAGLPPPFVVGVTGPPGAGKSTLVDGLCGLLRRRGARVGIVAVDPSSPLGGGAVLGDRVRMQRHATDAGVFIRSLGTRGAGGGLSSSAAQVVAALGAGGFSTVLVETVGVGQAEVDVAVLADVTAVVTVPGLGDDVQALKVGLLEIADVLVVNKGDREGADRAVGDLMAMLALAARPAPPILKTSATNGAGIEELVTALETLRQRPLAERAARRRRQAARQVAAVAADTLRARLQAALSGAAAGDPVSHTIASVADRTLDPWSAADLLMSVLK